MVNTIIIAGQRKKNQEIQRVTDQASLAHGIWLSLERERVIMVMIIIVRCTIYGASTRRKTPWEVP